MTLSCADVLCEKISALCRCATRLISSPWQRPSFTGSYENECFWCAESLILPPNVSAKIFWRASLSTVEHSCCIEMDLHSFRRALKTGHFYKFPFPSRRRETFEITFQMQEIASCVRELSHCIRKCPACLISCVLVAFDWNSRSHCGRHNERTKLCLHCIGILWMPCVYILSRSCLAISWSVFTLDARCTLSVSK